MGSAARLESDGDPGPAAGERRCGERRRDDSGLSWFGDANFSSRAGERSRGKDGFASVDDTEQAAVHAGLTGTPRARAGAAA